MASDLCDEFTLHPEPLGRVRDKMPGDETMLRLVEIFKALGDPTRARILYALSMEELCVCDLASLTDLSSSAISHQLRLLRANRLVRYRREGKRAVYALDDDHVRHLLTEGLCHARE